MGLSTSSVFPFPTYFSFSSFIPHQEDNDSDKPMEMLFLDVLDHLRINFSMIRVTIREDSCPRILKTSFR